MSKVEYEFIDSNIADSSLSYCMSIWIETQNILKAKQSELWDHYFSFIFSSCHSFVIHFVKSSVFLYLENLGDNPSLIVILNHGGNI